MNIKQRIFQLLKMQMIQTREKITLLEKALEQDDRNPAYFKHMLNNSLAHPFVNVEWFEGLLNEIRV